MLDEQGVKGVVYDGMPHGMEVGNPTETIGIRKAELRKKMDLVENTAQESEPSISKWLLFAVTNEGISYNYLKMVMGIPCEKDMYYNRRRKFYWLMSQRM